MTGRTERSSGSTASAALSGRAAWERMVALTDRGEARNVHLDIDMTDFVVATDLFPIEALSAYTGWNLEHDVSDHDRQTYFSAHRGGSQGDYRQGMRAKVANVVDALSTFPASKRAVISVVARPDAAHDDDAEAKCMRELHFHLDGPTLNGTVLFRSQAAEIFPKNIHFVGSLFAEVAAGIGNGVRPGSLHYLATVLVSDRT